MKGLKLDFSKDGAVFDFTQAVSGERSLTQNIGVITVTHVGSDKVVTEKGTNLRTRMSGGLYDIVSIQHACNFAVSDATDTVRAYQPITAEDADRVSSAVLELESVDQNVVVTALSVTAKSGVTVGNLIST